jgi:aspartate/methionine/tyrosine aminotransferase
MSIRDRMNPSFARVGKIDFPAFLELVEGGRTLMGWADPFYPDPCLPDGVIEATKRALDTGKTHYTLPIGLRELRRVVARKVGAYNHLTADPDLNVIITPGSDIGLYFAMLVLIAPGDEVLNPDPSYQSNAKNTQLMGAISVPVPLHSSRGFQLDIEEFEKRVTNRTKLIVLTQPNNPTSTVYRREQLEKLAEFAIAHDLFVVADHAFESTIFDGREFVTIASLPGMWERTISVFSTSKGMGMSGFRVGYNVACDEIMSVMHSTAVNVLGATNTFAQYGAIAAFEDDAFVEDFNRIYERRRRDAFDILNAIPGATCLLPESGFMIWLNIAALGSSKEVAHFLTEEARIIVNPGSSYGQFGEGYLRIMLGSLREEGAFQDAMARIAASLRKLSAANKLNT